MKDAARATHRANRTITVSCVIASEDAYDSRYKINTTSIPVDYSKKSRTTMLAPPSPFHVASSSPPSPSAGNRIRPNRIQDSPITTHHHQWMSLTRAHPKKRIEQGGGEDGDTAASLTNTMCVKYYNRAYWCAAQRNSLASHAPQGFSQARVTYQLTHLKANDAIVSATRPMLRRVPMLLLLIFIIC